MKVAVVGAGPAGLFLAILLRLADEGNEVVVHERNAPDATFGFGVVFSENTMAYLQATDPVTLERIVAASVRWDDAEVRHRGERVRIAGNGFSAIARKRLLQLLQERARELGVDLRFGAEADAEALVSQADVVVGADGVNSTVRRSRADRLAPAVELGRARYIWFATPQPFDALTFIIAENEHGWFGAHAYPYEDGTSTFIVETDTDAWRRAGLDVTGDLSPGETDQAALDYCTQVFAGDLNGHGLLGNNSRWQQFPRLTCGAWSDASVVLLGDAVHTAHFSVGSGTKMAMEDSIALAAALGRHGPGAAALAEYEQVRRPRVGHIQRVSIASQAWWEEFRHTTAFGPNRYAFHFQTRTGQLTGSKIAPRDAAFVAAAEREVLPAGAGGPLAVLGTPLQLGGVALGSRLAVAAATGTLHTGAVAVGPQSWAGADEVALETVALRSADDAGIVEVPDAEGRLGAAVIAGDDGAVLALARDRVGAARVEHPEAPGVCLSVLLPAGTVTDHVDDACLAALASALGAGSDLLAVAAAAGDANVPALLLCGRLRNEFAVATLLDGAGTLDEAATAILAGRADLARAPARTDQ